MDAFGSPIRSSVLSWLQGGRFLRISSPVFIFLTTDYADLEPCGLDPAEDGQAAHARKEGPGYDSDTKVRVMKMLTEMMLVLACLLFWTVALPLIGLMEVGVLVVDTVEAHTPHGGAAKPVQ